MDTCAAALCVGVGYHSDPESLQGLAHFVEHMVNMLIKSTFFHFLFSAKVFMGSRKYPGESAFDQFIAKSGGNNNAFTESETTTFYFTTQERYLKQGK